jgi:hypothetical protein
MHGFEHHVRCASRTTLGEIRGKLIGLGGGQGICQPLLTHEESKSPQSTYGKPDGFHSLRDETRHCRLAVGPRDPNRQDLLRGITIEMVGAHSPRSPKIVDFYTRLQKHTGVCLTKYSHRTGFQGRFCKLSTVSQLSTPGHKKASPFYLSRIFRDRTNHRRVVPHH